MTHRPNLAHPLPVLCGSFLNGWGEKKIKRNAVTFENDMKFKCQRPQIKQYWNTAMLICLCTVCGCFHAMAATRALPTEALFTLHYKLHLPSYNLKMFLSVTGIAIP